MSKVSKIIVAFRDDATTKEQEEHLAQIRKAHDASKKNAPTAEGVTFVYRDLINGYAGSFSGEVVDLIKSLVKSGKIVKKYEDDLAMQRYGMPITKTKNWGLWRVSHKGSVVPQLQLQLHPPQLYDYVCQPQYGQNVPVYVIDTGLNNVSNELDHTNVTYIDAIQDPMAMPLEDETDEHTHGTVSATLIAGQTLGAAKNCRLIACKFTRRGVIYFSDMINALSKVARHHRDTHGENTYAVVNCSWGCEVGLGLQGLLFETAVRTAIEHSKLIIVAAAGNSGLDAGGITPARMPEVITVGATNHLDQMAAFSNHGDAVDIYAPGTELPSVINANDPDLREFVPGGSDGTSFAAPLVVGIIACLIAASAADGIQRVWDPVNVKAELHRLARPSVYQQIYLVSNGSDMA